MITILAYIGLAIVAVFVMALIFVIATAKKIPNDGKAFRIVSDYRIDELRKSGKL